MIVSRIATGRIATAVTHQLLSRSAFTVRPSSYRHVTRNMHLEPNKTLVNGQWVAAADAKQLAVLNPATGQTVGNVPDMNAAVDTQAAIEAAHTTFNSSQWQALTAKERAGLLKRWLALLEENKQRIAEIMTAESGKPLAESLGEIAYGNSFVEWFAEEARRIYGEIVPSPSATKQMFITRQPIGVAALITPWNFPHAMITRKAAAALAAGKYITSQKTWTIYYSLSLATGCTVVIKPAEDTPLTAVALAALATEAGFPAGAVNVVTCSRSNAPAVGELLCTSPLVSGISFTGSTEVGRILYRHCAGTIKRIGLELGGNAPFIVFESADLQQTVQAAMFAKFRNCGQACIAANRFLVQDSVYDAFVERLLTEVGALKVGAGDAAGVHCGPLINDAQFRKVDAMVADARTKGARVLVGGAAMPELGALYYQPTVVEGVTEGMQLWTEEVFGPVVTLIRFKTEEEALRLANATRRGLAGYFFSQDLNQAFRVARKLEVGMVGINDGAISTAEAAFGGVKESGIGREGSRHGVDEYVEMKYLCFGNLK